MVDKLTVELLIESLDRYKTNVDKLALLHAYAGG